MKKNPKRFWILLALILVSMTGFILLKIYTKKDESMIHEQDPAMQTDIEASTPTVEQPTAPEQPESKGKRGARLNMVYQGFCNYVDSLKEATASNLAVPADETVENLSYRMYGDFNAMLAVMKDTVQRNELRKHPPYTYANPNAVKRMFNNVSVATSMLLLDRLKKDCRSLYTEVNIELNKE